MIKFINYPQCLNSIFVRNSYLYLTNLSYNIQTIMVSNSFYSDNYFLNLPIYLKNLYCSKNKIYKLDNLPTNLIVLDCSENNIVYLDNLPESLVILECSYNKLICLDNLPCGLKYLSCDYNEIILLNSLPDSLEEVFAKCNHIKLIDRLPKSLTRANFTSNPLIKTPKCSNSILLLNYSLDAEKADIVDKVINLGYKFTYGSYHTVKYFGYGIGLLIVLPVVPFVFAYLDLLKFRKNKNK